SLPSRDEIEFIGTTFEMMLCSPLLSAQTKGECQKKKGDSASSTTTPTPTPTITAESAPRLSVSAKGKRPLRATTTVEPTDLQRTEAEQLKMVLKRSRRETHISQQSGSGTGEGTGSKPGVPDVPSDDSEEELSWKSSEDEEVDSQEEGNESNDDSDDGSDKDSEEIVKSGTGVESIFTKTSSQSVSLVPPTPIMT
nr:hypothetical protein [Tanacetum cinerariifolium]